MLPNTPKCSQTSSNVATCAPMLPNARKLPKASKSRMLPNAPKCIPNAPKCSQMFPNARKCFQMLNFSQRNDNYSQMLPKILPNALKSFQTLPDFPKCRNTQTTHLQTPKPQIGKPTKHTARKYINAHKHKYIHKHPNHTHIQNIQKHKHT